jgi:nucleotide sugar dehydrogenase
MTSGQWRSEVAIVGQGYVGLPLAVAAAKAGHRVTGIDQDARRVAALNAGRSPVGDVADGDVRALLASGHYRAATDFTEVASVATTVLCVPTPYRNQAPDLSYIACAARGVGAALRPGSLIILESTTYPGTTEEYLQPILEQASGLVAGAPGGFELAFSPERIDPGNAEFGLANTPKIVGGTTAEATAQAERFYSSFIGKVVPVSGPKTAEAAKLLENTFRHINIALVNELAVLCRDLGVDVWEVIDAAASKPFGFLPFYPGPGVGGHCIPVDPMYLSWRVRQLGGAAKFIELARDVNAAMPAYCVTRVQDLLNEHRQAINGANVLVLGVAYKANVGDLRESPALPLLEGLRRKGAHVTYHDPHVPSLPFGDGARMRSAQLDDERLGSADCVVILTRHDAVDYQRVIARAPLVFDTRNVPEGRKAPNVVRL